MIFAIELIQFLLFDFAWHDMSNVCISLSKNYFVNVFMIINRDFSFLGSIDYISNKWSSYCNTIVNCVFVGVVFKKDPSYSIVKRVKAQ